MKGAFKMVNLNQTNVISKFRQLSECSQAQANEAQFIVSNACHLISRLLDEKKCTTADIACAEYAAATVAFYDYVCKENAKDKVICSLTGKASANVDYKSRIESAASLRSSALEQLRPFTVSCDHLFMTMEG